MAKVEISRTRSCKIQLFPVTQGTVYKTFTELPLREAMKKCYKCFKQIILQCTLYGQISS